MEPDSAPRTEWACQPVACIISAMLAPFARRSSAVIAAILPVGLFSGLAVAFGAEAGAAFLTDEARSDLGDTVEAAVIGVPTFGFRARATATDFLAGDVGAADVGAVAVRGFANRAAAADTSFDCADLFILLSIHCNGISAVTSASPGRGLQTLKIRQRG